MNLLFFQNCISPHQIPYIRECAKDSRINDVYLITPRIDYSTRKQMGWDNTNLIKNTTIKLLLRPTNQQIQQLLKDNENMFCFFSGIRADQDIFQWFKLSLNFQIKRYIITEPPFTYKKPEWMHYIRFFIQDYRFVKKIDGIFGIGDQAVKYYHNIYNKWKVFPFQYVTDTTQRMLPVPSGNIKLVFVGSLTPRKNVKFVLKALKENHNFKFTIIGDGIERKKLEKIAIKNHVDTTFMGTQPMNLIPKLMQQHDVLILPSLHDGWGAVVNEAMTLGLYVIVSNQCGAKSLIRNKEEGYIYKYNKITELKKAIQFITHNITNIRKNTNKRISQAQRIQGEAVAKYFINCILQS